MKKFIVSDCAACSVLTFFLMIVAVGSIFTKEYLTACEVGVFSLVVALISNFIHSRNDVLFNSPIACTIIFLGALWATVFCFNNGEYFLAVFCGVFTVIFPTLSNSIYNKGKND